MADHFARTTRVDLRASATGTYVHLELTDQSGAIGMLPAQPRNRGAKR